MTVAEAPTRRAAPPDSDRIARLVVENAVGFAIFTTDLLGTVTSWNGGAEKVLGWSAAEMLGRSACVIFTPEDNASGACEAEMEEARRQGRAEDERWHLKQDGSRFWASGLMMRLDDEESGEHIGFVKMIRDRTRQHMQEARLAESEARLRLAVDASRMAIWEWDIIAQRLAPSAELAEFLGLEPEDLGDVEKVRSRYYPGDRRRIVEAGNAAVESNDPHFEVEFRFYRSREDLRWFLLRAEIIRGAGGQPERAIGTVTDITRRKTAEDALRKLTDTLEDQVNQRTRALLQAEEALRQSQKMEAIGQLTGGVAHDFNNLLTIIRSSVDLLRRKEVPEDRKRRYIDAISDTVDRAANLTRQLLAFARRQALAPEIFDAVERTRGMCEMVKTIVGARIDLQIDDRCGSCFVEADVGQFEAAIVNLAVNARDAMEGEGTLLIRLEEVTGIPKIRGHHAAGGDFVAITVGDTGGGIAPELLPHIFEPFFTTKEVGKGTGLGLSQVYGFAKQSGGDVQVASEVGSGTRFTLYLPRRDPARASEAKPSPTRAAAEQALRILVVEDNVQVGEFATQILQDLGHSPTLAVNALEALELLDRRREDFDLVFSDVVMPGMSGLELGEQIRRRYPELRVVLTSGYSHILSEQGSHGFELLQKPYSVDLLSRVLSSAAG